MRSHKEERKPSSNKKEVRSGKQDLHMCSTFNLDISFEWKFFHGNASTRLQKLDDMTAVRKLSGFGRSIPASGLQRKTSRRLRSWQRNLPSTRGRC